MAPVPSAFKRLLNAVSRTQTDEIDCRTCFEVLDRFADLDAAGKDPEEVLPRVADHLERCRDCREEYEALQAALRAMDAEG